MNKTRENKRFLENYTAMFQYRGHTYTCVISPARVTVEDALRKLASDQYAGFFDKPTYRSGVVFSL